MNAVEHHGVVWRPLRCHRYGKRALTAACIDGDARVRVVCQKTQVVNEMDHSRESRVFEKFSRIGGMTRYRSTRLKFDIVRFLNSEDRPLNAVIPDILVTPNMI